MPRQSDFSPREDEIILQYAGQPSTVTSAALEAAGFQARTARKITARRNYLKKREADGGVSLAFEQSPIARLEAERICIEQRLETLDAERDSLTKRMNDIRTELQEAVAAIAAG